MYQRQEDNLFPGNKTWQGRFRNGKFINPDEMTMFAIHRKPVAIFDNNFSSN